MVWWVVLVLRGVLPTLFAIVMGALIAAVQHGTGLGAPLAAAASARASSRSSSVMRPCRSR
jgi:tetrahydromethanopterin S-methyltransferase subunit E